MNTITIKNSYFTSKIEISINGEQISPYSELATISARPFEERIGGILKALDAEVFDDYSIDYYGMPVPYEILKSKMTESEYCKNIQFFEIPSMTGPKAMYDRIFGIGKAYGISLEKKEKATIYCAMNDISLVYNENFEQVETMPADIGFFNSQEEAEDALCKVAVVSDERWGFKWLRGQSIYKIPRNGMEDFFQYYFIYYVNVPRTMELMTALKYKKVGEKDELELKAIQTGVPQYYMGQLPETMDKGKVYEVEFYSFPENAFSLKISERQIADYENGYIEALTSGVTEVSVIDENCKIRERRQLSVIEHHYATKIRIVPRFEYLKINEKSSVDVIVEPEDAEDANDLIWEVGNPHILRINEGNVFALDEGVTSVTLSGKEAFASIKIEVKPELKSLSFEQSFIRLKNGETTIIDCKVIPPNASVEHLVWELDNRTIAAHNPSKDGRRCQITALKGYQGKGNIRCYDANTGYGAICNLEVVSKIKRNVIGKISLMCMLFGVFIPFLLPVSIGTSVYGLVKDEDTAQKSRYVIDAVLSTLILMIWISAS